MREFKLIIQPDAEEPEAAEVYVDGHLDGRPYRFLLDTGAAKSSVVLDDYTATFESVGQSRSSGVFAPVSDDLITISNIEVGPISRRNITLTRAPATSGKTNLIGMDLLKDFCLHFRFDEQRVVVETGDMLESADVFEPLFLDTKFHPYIAVQLGDVQAKAVWGTGASLTIADTNFIKSHPAFFVEAGRSTGTDSGRTQVETPMFVMSGVIIGQHSFPPHKVAGVDLSRVNATLDMPMNLILGYSTWRRANWLFDFPGKRWVISKWLDVR
jgi:predicted aspartyl protease